MRLFILLDDLFIHNLIGLCVPNLMVTDLNSFIGSHFPFSVSHTCDSASSPVKGQTLSNHVRPYWQVEPPTAADSERLSEGGGVVGEVNQLNNQSVAENEALPTTPDGSQQPMRRRGKDHVTICPITMLF